MTATLPDALTLAERIRARIDSRAAFRQPRQPWHPLTPHLAGDRRALDRAVRAVERAEDGLRECIEGAHASGRLLSSQQRHARRYAAARDDAWEALRDLGTLYGVDQ